MPRLSLIAASCLAAVAPLACGDTGGTPMVSLSAGDFIMGCAAADRLCQGGTDEQPKRTVHMSAFKMDEYEVKIGDYMACVRLHDCTEPAVELTASSDHPVTNVSWDQAEKYCEHVQKHLPTEAQWERAARGVAPDERIYPWGNDAPDCDHATLYGCGNGSKAVVSAVQGKSPTGVVGMSGNVREWVADWYGAYPRAGGTDPTGPASGDQKVNKGGSYVYGPEYARISNRVAEYPADAVNDLGFRCAR